MIEKKRQLTLEYAINSTVPSLYSKISSDIGLRSWFADNVEQNNNEFIFLWNKMPYAASLIDKKENIFVRFCWEEDFEDGYYFEMRVETTELTGAITLIITDFAEEDEYQDTINLWENNIKKLKRSLGIN